MHESEINGHLSLLNEDKEAFNQLYTYFFPKIVMHVYFIYKNYGLDEDVAQEVFIKLLKLKETNGVGLPNGWLYTTSEHLARNKVIKFQSDRRNEQNFTLNQKLLETIKNDPVESLLLEECYEMINRLDEPMRRVIIMKVYEGYSVKEISEILGISRDAVRQRFFRGKKKIREEYFDDDT